MSVHNRVMWLRDVLDWTDLPLPPGATIRVNDAGDGFELTTGHTELVMHDFGSGLEPVTDDDGDYLYAQFGDT